MPRGVEEYVDLILIPVALHLQHHWDAEYAKSAKPRLCIKNLHSRGEREDRSGNGIARAALKGHIARKLPAAEDQFLRRGFPCLTHADDVVRQVLTVCIDGDNAFIRRILVVDIRQRGFQGGAFTAVHAVMDDLCIRLKGIKQGAFVRTAAVVDDDEIVLSLFVKIEYETT
ncbi:hypothetical protein SDC9_167861 [bioreactor metagenome]|uniref:Uncharacterized protein n=1 Tax=bioreactor metagenome TaxID=1076179 RepID=A0A645G3G2_9ZZZZ